MIQLPNSEITRKEAVDLWIKDRSEYAKKQVILSTYPMIYHVMRQFNININDEDVFMLGIEAILSALNGFDPEKGYEFVTYATAAIRNTILYCFRRCNRRVRTTYITDCHVALHNDDVLTIELSSDYDIENSVVNKIYITDILNSYDQKKQMIFTMYYIEDKTQTEIAEVVGCSQAHISRILKSIRNDLEEVLA